MSTVQYGYQKKKKKKSGHNHVCTIKYKTHTIKNVRGDGPILFCVDQSPLGIGCLLWEAYSEKV